MVFCARTLLGVSNLTICICDELGFDGFSHFFLSLLTVWIWYKVLYYCKSNADQQIGPCSVTSDLSIKVLFKHSKTNHCEVVINTHIVYRYVIFSTTIISNHGVFRPLVIEAASNFHYRSCRFGLSFSIYYKAIKCKEYPHLTFFFQTIQNIKSFFCFVFFIFYKNSDK